MDNAIWALFYDISPEDKAEYLHWFHSQHIPDKLQRDGYLWAAHYQVVDPGGKFRPILDRLHYSDDFSLSSGAGYMAFFGGQTTRTFYDPSPDQLKLQQDELTRDMISKRIKPVSIIYCEEWRVHGPLPKTSDFLQSAAPVIQIGRFDSVGSELDLGAWYAQERMCAIENTQGVSGRESCWLLPVDLSIPYCMNLIRWNPGKIIFFAWKIHNGLAGFTNKLSIRRILPLLVQGSGQKHSSPT